MGLLWCIAFQFSLCWTTGCFIITVARVSAHFWHIWRRFLWQNYEPSDKQIIFMRVIGILDAPLVVTGCHRWNTDSSPAWACDHLANLDQRPCHKIVTWRDVWNRANMTWHSHQGSIGSTYIEWGLSLEPKCFSGNEVISPRLSAWWDACMPASRPIDWDVQISFASYGLPRWGRGCRALMDEIVDLSDLWGHNALPLI